MSKPIDLTYRDQLVQRLLCLRSVQYCRAFRSQLELFRRPPGYYRKRFKDRKPVIEATIEQVIREYF